MVFEYVHGHVAAGRAEQPHPRFLLRFSVRLLQDLDRRLVGVHPVVRQQLRFHPLVHPRQPARVHVHHPVRHVLARYRRVARRLDVRLYAVERQRHDVLAVDDPGEQRRGGDRARYRRLRLRGAHDDALALLAARVGAAALAAAVDVAAVLLDDEVGRDDADAAGDLDLHLGERAAALGARAVSLGDLVVDDHGLELGEVDGRLAAPPAGLLGKDVVDLGLGGVGLGRGFDLVEQRELLGDDLL